MSNGNGLPADADTTFTAADKGTKTLPFFLGTVGQQTVTVSVVPSSQPAGSPAIPAITSPAITVTAGAAANFGVSGYPTTVTAGVPNLVTVTVTDAFGNPASGYTGAVTFSSTDPRATFPTGATFDGTETGSKQFPVSLGTAGTQAITVTDPSRAGFTGTQSGITVVAAAAARYDLTGFPASVTAGTPGTFTVTARDVFGNLATGYAGTVTFRSSDAAAGLPAAYTFTAADKGVHQFSTTFRSAGVQSLTAVDAATPTIIGSLNGTVSVTAGAATTFTVGGFPASVQAGAKGTFTVRAFDAFGNPASGYAGTVVISGSDPQGGYPAAATLVSGVGTFTATFNTPGTQSLTATDSKDKTITATQAGITVLASPASKPSLFAVGTDAGIIGQVTVYNPDLTIRTQFQPFEQEFSGGVRVAMAQTPDATQTRLAVVPGPGRQPDLRVYDLAGNTVQSFLPFETTFTGGMYVSTGDINRDGFDDYIITPDQSGGPRVKIISGKDGAVLAGLLRDRRRQLPRRGADGRRGRQRRRVPRRGRGGRVRRRPAGGHLRR